MKGYKILIVEDDEDIVETVKYSLETKGFVVDVAYDGLHALRKARKNGCDLMLLDIMLPGKNGYEVSRILKEEMDQKKIAPFPILVLTARKVNSPEREDFLATWSKADEFMYKPFEMEDLVGRIAEHMERTMGAGVAGER